MISPVGGFDITPIGRRVRWSGCIGDVGLGTITDFSRVLGEVKVRWDVDGSEAWVGLIDVETPDGEELEL